LMKFGTIINIQLMLNINIHLPQSKSFLHSGKWADISPT
jgi:hypothetical protein